ncbi:secondary metabolism regulator LAE1 [Echria macrotheca]|uniref:Secondary metabolism regulator LAE1 n=1 Tax=Echria macrotheca TaxID=438768 RepID=A0AAJ0FFP6_9PEZI|nr:secondary metabolism regulator LAE1 [Echria macrotheca]
MSGSVDNAPLQVDEHHDDSSDADSTYDFIEGQSTESLSSSILRYRQENGRTYHAFRDGRYYFPNDETENERLDLQHHIFYLTLNSKLGLAPPCEKGYKVGRVLDLGTGTGIWAMDYGDEHPEAEVIGIDLSPTQSQFVPPNVSFQIDDFEDDWTFSQPFDYIHSRMNNSSVMDWKRYIKQCFTNLNPGGYLEIQEFGVAKSDDDSLPTDSALKKSMDLFQQAADITHHTLVELDSLADMLRDTGFVDIVVSWYKWPSNTWPRDARFKELGMWNNENVTSGLQGFLMAALTRTLGWQREEVDVLVAKARTDVNNRRIHAYWPIIVVYGRKPD